jgi:hypothetical protein
MSDGDQQGIVSQLNERKQLVRTAFLLYILQLVFGQLLFILFGIKDYSLNLLRLPNNGWAQTLVPLLSFGLSFFLLSRLFPKAVVEIVWSRFAIWNLYMVVVVVGLWLMQSLYLNVREG